MRADDGRARRDFDYWVLSLSWSPQFCATSARDQDGPQCAGPRPYGFVVHGLWPQYERGYPSDCGRAAYLPEDLVRRLLPIMPSKPLILHEWRQHGSCSRLDAADYAARIEQAWNGVHVPPRYESPRRAVSETPAQLEDAFIQSNPGLRGDGIALQCSGRYLAEVRLCLDRELAPRACGRDLRDRCGSNLVLRPLRGD